MEILLKCYVLPKFSSSRTKIVVTGYYKPISQFTDIGILKSLGATIGEMISSGGDSITGIYVGAFLTLVSWLSNSDEEIKRKAIENCKVFYDTSVSATQQVIKKLDSDGLKIFYASLAIHDVFALFQNNSYLWGRQPSFGTSYSSDDEMRSIRAPLCDSLTGIDKLMCVEAGIAHPNAEFGAPGYAEAIISKIFPTPAPCKALEKEYESLDNEYINLQKGFLTAETGLRQALRLERDQIYKARKIAFENLSKCKRDYYNNNDSPNVGSILSIVRARGWTLKPIGIRQVSKALGLASPISLRHI
jgi:hypothetical protein